MFHLGIMLCATAFLAYYENYVTSVAMAPGPPHIYNTVRDLLEQGRYKIGEPEAAHGVQAPEIRYRYVFVRNKISHLLNSSFVRLNDTQAAGRTPDGVAYLATVDVHRRLSEKVIVGASGGQNRQICHVVEEPFQPVFYWVHLEGMLRNEMVRWMQRILESGITVFWEMSNARNSELATVKRTRQESIDYWRTDPEPVSMDFEILKIFQYCGCMLGVSALIFVCEMNLPLLAFWKVLESGFFGL
jgi:hypothetical protein